jgi:hypothetical protein
VVPVPAGGQDTQLEQIRKMQAKLDEEAGQLLQLRQNIGQEWAGRALAGEACHQAQDVQRRITDDARARLPPASSGVGQNLAVAAILSEAEVPPGASRRDFPIHARSLGPHRAHAGHDACSPGSPRQRAPPPRPSSPPRREGAPRLPPRRGGRYDSGEDRSPSPEPPG